MVSIWKFSVNNNTEGSAQDKKYSTCQFQDQKAGTLIATTEMPSEIFKANIPAIKLFKLTEGKFVLTLTVCILLFLTMKRSIEVFPSKHNQGF